jgi:hypothetical protein
MGTYFGLLPWGRLAKLKKNDEFEVGDSKGY